MNAAAQILIALVAIAHIGFLILEMALWTKPAGLKIFRMTPQFAKESKALAANQGLYNGFLAAGLIWSLWPIGAPAAASAIASFFLISVVIAGVFGALTVSRRIFFIQALPAFVALSALYLPG